MIKHEKTFYKCLGFQTQKKYNKPLFFYHVPKCAGTTFVVLISHLFKKTHRLTGPLFANNDKGGQTAFEKYIKNSKLVNSSNLDFLYGHVPFEIHKKLNKNFIFITIVREPVQRCLSHYAWGINRGYYSIDDDIENLFKHKKLPENILVNQFSGKGFNDSNHHKSVELSLNNLCNKIDFLFDVEDIFKLLSLIISYYDLPNLFFQNQQINYNKINISKKKVNIVKKYNEKDIILYSALLKNKKIKNHNIKKKGIRNIKSYLYSSPHLLVNKHKTLLLNENKIKNIEKKLFTSNYNIKSI